MCCAQQHMLDSRRAGTRGRVAAPWMVRMQRTDEGCVFRRTVRKMAGPEQRTRDGSLPRGMNEAIVTERKRPAMGEVERSCAAPSNTCSTRGRVAAPWMVRMQRTDKGYVFRRTVRKTAGPEQRSRDGSLPCAPEGSPTGRTLASPSPKSQLPPDRKPLPKKSRDCCCQSGAWQAGPRQCR